MILSGVPCLPATRVPLLLVLAASLLAAPLRGEGQTNDETPRVFEIVPERSSLMIIVGRAGLLSALGHAHAVISRSLRGEIRLAPDPAQSRARLVVPVNDLAVDEDAARERAGLGPPPPAADRAATRRNMLGPEVLDAAHHPTVEAEILPGDRDGMFEIRLSFRGRIIPLQMPATLTLDGDRLQVESRFRLGHRELGLRPFAALGGALRVAETLEFDLRLEAAAAGR